MNPTIKNLIKESGFKLVHKDSGLDPNNIFAPKWNGECSAQVEMLIRLVVEGCREIVLEKYRNTQLDKAIPLLEVEQEISKYFGLH